MQEPFHMTQQLSHTPLGVIEGFFGEQWHWHTRHQYADLLRALGYDFYIYAPKGDAYLRKRWQEDWPQAHFESLKNTRQYYQQAGIDFGIGLSPYEVYRDFDAQSREDLIKKINQINILQPDILCILFDDMKGDLPDLAKQQSDICHIITEYSSAKRIIMCPSYYSTDPVLEKVFGKMPENYWQDLGTFLDSSIDIFWTGEKVCSKNYSEPHLQEITTLLQRKPFLWDNYPVNDGAKMSNFLHIGAFKERPSSLREHISGHAVNPMNQAWLSLIPLHTLMQSYRKNIDISEHEKFSTACKELCGEKLSVLLEQNFDAFQNQGLAQLNSEQRTEISSKYKSFTNNPYAKEVVAWLNDEYEFDPDCLTD